MTPTALPGGQRIPIKVPLECQFVHPNGDRCRDSYADTHVHHPAPCEFRNDERHHEYLPPRSVRLLIGGRVKTLRFAPLDPVP